MSTHAPMPSTGQHRFNSMHVYCRFRACNFPRCIALGLARAWEAIVHRLIYRPKES